MLPIEIGWCINGTTGWGLYGLHLALGLARQGRRVYAPQQEWHGIPATLRPSLVAMQEPLPIGQRAIRFDPWGNHKPKFVEYPSRYRVLLAVFEDTDAVDVEQMGRYDLVLAPSTWAYWLLEAEGIAAPLFHQGFDSSIFYPAPKRRSDSRFMVFSGGKLEYRKGQDIVVEAFRQFIATPEGKDAILVTAWQNPWPQTMQGIWLSGYVKGVPEIKQGRFDVHSWLMVNGIPDENHIELGMLTQSEMASAMRECDVALFPNRCEGATNMPLVEALGCGIPCIAGKWTGQADVSRAHGTPSLGPSSGCSLYIGVDGWKDADPECCAMLLTTFHNEMNRSYEMDDWSWDTRTAELHNMLMEYTDL